MRLDADGDGDGDGDVLACIPPSNLRLLAAPEQEQEQEQEPAAADDHDDWTWRDGRIVRYLPQTGEHQVALADRAGTVLWLKLHTHLFRDWTALPRMRERDIALRGLVSLLGALPGEADGGESGVETVEAGDDSTTTSDVNSATKAARKVVGNALKRFLQL